MITERAPAGADLSFLFLKADKLRNAKQTSCGLPLLPAAGVAVEAGLGRREEQVEDEDKQGQADGEAEDTHLGGWLRKIKGKCPPLPQEIKGWLGNHDKRYPEAE